MHYIIYPDTLFFENLLCNLLFLALMKSLFFQAATWKRIFFAGTLTALCNTLAFILFFRCIWVLQLGVLFPAAGIMVCGCLQLQDARRILYLLYQMILWTLVLGGIFQVLEQWTEISSGELIFATTLITIILGISEKIFKIYKRQNECMREIVLYWNEKCCHMRGFADTGNQLFDPISKKPVSIISMETWKELMAEAAEPLYYAIPYQSVGQPKGILKGAQRDYMVILQGNDSRIIEKPMIAITEQPFTGIFHYSILLHNDFCQGG